MTKFSKSVPTTYFYSTYNKDENKRANGTKKCVVKRKLKFEDYKANQLENEIN